MRIIRTEEVTSTNDYIRQQDEHLTLCWAESQTKGRGQKGNSWESEKGRNLTFSFLLHPERLPAGKQFILSKAVSLAVVEALRTTGTQARIKWPNDIYVGDRKICGILIEHDLSGDGMIRRSVVGIGINVNQQRFLSDAPNPTSLLLETGRICDREALLAAFIDRFTDFYHIVCHDPENGLIDDAYLELLYRKGEWHRYRDAEGCFEGRITGIGPEGELLVEKRSGAVNGYRFKEVSYLL